MVVNSPDVSDAVPSRRRRALRPAAGGSLGPDEVMAVGRYALAPSVWAIRARTSVLTSASGNGASGVKRMVPFDV